jgi:hypothetical protein
MGRKSHDTTQGQFSMSYNVLLFVGDDIVVHQFLNSFIPRAVSEGINPVLIKVRNKHRHHNHPEMKRYSFYEDTLLNKFAIPYIEKNPSPVFTLSSVKQLIENYNLKYLETDNVNDPQFVSKLSKMDFRGAFSIRCFQIFKKPIIDIVKEKGFFGNSHPGLLPEYRGVMCMMRGMVEQAENVGWNLHIVEEGIDTGSILKTITIPYNPKFSMPELFLQTMPALVNGWIDIITSHHQNNLLHGDEQKSSGRYFTYPTYDEMEAWLQTNKLVPLSAKRMVKYYCDMIYAEKSKFTSDAQNFKTFLINNVASFETMIELETASALPVDGKQKAA